MSKKARAKKKGRSNANVGSAPKTQPAIDVLGHDLGQESESGKSVVQVAQPLSAVPEPEVSTIRLHDTALDDDASPSILPPAPLEVKPEAVAAPRQTKRLAKNEAQNEKGEDDEAISMAFFDAQNIPSIAPVEVDADDDLANESLAIRRLTLSPTGVARRAQLGRYVAAAVGLAALVGLAGAVRGRSTRDAMSAQLSERPALAAEPRAPVAAAQQIQQAPVVQTTPIALAEVAVPEAVKPVDDVKPTEAKLGEEKKDEKKADTASPEEKPVEEQRIELDPVQAKKEKNVAHNALEAGKHAKAIEAGERSVALDPTDAEAWLILGVAYQEKGKKEDAKRCFKSCLTEGKRGPKGECAMMAH